jgi:SAM-dependent methyltransferase
MIQDPGQPFLEREKTLLAFRDKLIASLTGGNFVRLVLSGGGATGGLDKVLGRSVELRGALHLSLTFRYANRDETKNLLVSEVSTWLMKHLGQEFRTGLLCTTEADWQFTFGKDRPPKLVRHKASSTTTPSREHDQPRRSLLDASAQDWLSGLGVTDEKGKIRSGMAAKHAQICRYLEIVSHVAKENAWLEPSRDAATTSEWTIADMGCGKGYLTFGLWHLFRRVYRLSVRVVGVEVRSELVLSNQGLAGNIGAEGLEFVAGTIDSASIGSPRALIALHACDTATDEAILYGVDSGAQLIMVAPCCHRQIRHQVGRPAPVGPLLCHGLMEERLAEWLTDGLRTLYLEWAGYRTKVVEFVSLEHTSKNLMLIGSMVAKPFTDPAARARIEDLQSFFGIQRHALDRLLGQAPEPESHGPG